VYSETDWTRKWEATLRHSRWVEKYGKFYPRGVDPARMNNLPDPPPPARRAAPSFQALAAPATRWAPRPELATIWQPPWQPRKA
jgi:hypothetical protein